MEQAELLKGRGDCGGIQKNLEDCTCLSDTCELKGHCCACVAWHRDHAPKSPLPHCLRELDGVTWSPRE